MKQMMSYLVDRNGVKIWLLQGMMPEPTDNVIEQRDMLIADDDCVLMKDGEEIGCCIWLKDTKPEDYTEIQIEEQIEEQIDTF